MQNLMNFLNRLLIYAIIFLVLKWISAKILDMLFVQQEDHNLAKKQCIGNEGLFEIRKSS